MATAKKKSGKRVTNVVGGSTIAATFKQPNWRQWMVRPLSIRQAAFITMGWQPMPGLIGLLKSKPLKRNEFRMREAALNEALGGGELPRAGDGKLPVVDLVTVLKFAQAKKWSMHKSTPKILERLRALEVTGAGAGRASLVAAMPIQRPAQGAELVELNLSTGVAHQDRPAVRRGEETEPSRRLEKTLSRCLGALTVVLRDVVNGGSRAALLTGNRLNVSAVAERLQKAISDAEGSTGPVPGFTKRNLHGHITTALKDFELKADAFDIGDTRDDGVAPS